MPRFLQVGVGGLGDLIGGFGIAALGAGEKTLILALRFGQPLLRGQGRQRRQFQRIQIALDVGDDLQGAPGIGLVLLAALGIGGSDRRNRLGFGLIAGLGQRVQGLNRFR